MGTRTTRGIGAGRRRSARVGALLAVVTAAGTSIVPAGPADAATSSGGGSVSSAAAGVAATADDVVRIMFDGVAFEPEVLMVEPGTPLMLVNESAQPIAVASEGGEFAASPLPAGGGAAFVLQAARAYAYGEQTTGATGHILVGSTDFLGAPGTDPVDDHIPDAWPPPEPEGGVTVDPTIGAEFSTSRLTVRFVEGTTVADAEAALAAAGVTIIAGNPTSRLLTVSALAAADHSAVRAAEARLDAEPVVDLVIRQAPTAIDVVPEPVASPNGMVWDNQIKPGSSVLGDGPNSGQEAAGIPSLWNFTETLQRADAQSGRPDVDVVVFDGGFDTSHQDLFGRLSTDVVCEDDLYTWFGTRNGQQEWCTGNTRITDPGVTQGSKADGNINHGNNVSGIIGAFPPASSANGYTGANVVSDMIGIEFGSVGWGDLFDEVLDLKESGHPSYRDLRVINISASNLPRLLRPWGTANSVLSCGPGENDDHLPTTRGPCLPWTDDANIKRAQDAGRALVPMLQRAAGLGVVFVVAAGNSAPNARNVKACIVPDGMGGSRLEVSGRDTESGPRILCTSTVGWRPLTPAEVGVPSSKVTSEIAAASHQWRPEWGPNPVIVVEALSNSHSSPTAEKASFSQNEGTVSAIGYQLGPRWTVADGGGYWGPSQGTSQATPIVSGVVSSMLLLDPTMGVQEVRDRVATFADTYDSDNHTVSDRIDPLGSMLAVDGGLLALLDVNDHSVDGNRRVVYGPGGAVVAEDEDSSSQAGYHTDPDGKVDMRDFRRMRDAWLQNCGFDPTAPECAGVIGIGIDLDGEARHPKKDLNFDGCVHLSAGQPACPTPETAFPRFDFNGDGHLSISRTTQVNLEASSESLTDLGVFAKAFEPAVDGTGWHADPAGLEQMLADLMISGDVEVAVGSLIDAGATDISVTLRDAGSGTDLFVRPVDSNEPSVVVTVPADAPHEIVVAGLDGGAPFEYRRTFDLVAGQDAYYSPCGVIELTSDDGVIAFRSSTAITATVVGCDEANLYELPIELTVSREGGGGDATVSDSTIVTAAPGAGDEGVATGEFRSNAQPGTYSLLATTDLPTGGGLDSIPIEATIRIEVTEGYVYEVVDERPTGELGTNPSVAPDETVIYTSRSVPNGPHDQLNRWNDGVATEIGARLRQLTNVDVDLGDRVDVTTDGWALVRGAHQDDDNILSTYRRWALDMRYWFPTSVRTLVAAGFSTPVGVPGMPTGNGVGGRVFPVHVAGDVGTRIAEHNVYQLALGPQLATDWIRHADNGYTVGRADLWPIETTGIQKSTSAIVVGDANLGTGVDPDSAFVVPLAVQNAPDAVAPTPWDLLGDRPDISAAGDVVAFVGDRDGHGPAVFLSVRANDEGSFHEPVAITGPGRAGTTELEHLGAGQLHLEIDADADDHDLGVGVIQEERGRDGVLDDVVTVAFVGSPNQAGAGVSQGLYTMRVTIGEGGQVVAGHAEPVVQIGDTEIGGEVVDPVESIGWHRVVTDGLFDAEQIDHQLAFWVKTGETDRIVHAKWIGSPDGTGPSALAGAVPLMSAPSTATRLQALDAALAPVFPGTSDGAEVPMVIIGDVTPEPRDVVTFTNRTVPLDQYGGYLQFAVGGTTYSLQPKDSASFLIDETTSLITFTGPGGSAIAVLDIQTPAGPPPIAITGGPYAVDAGDELVLDASASTDDGEIVQYDWEIDGDGDFDDAHGAVTRISWADVQDAYCSGNCTTSTSGTLSLRVTDDDALTSTSSTAVDVVVDVQDFTLAIYPNDELLNPNTTTTLRVDVGSIGGFAGDVQLELISPVPEGYTVRIPTTRVTAPGSASIIVTVPANAVESAFDVQVRGTSGALVHDTTGTASVVFGLIPICYETVTGTVVDQTTRQPIADMEVRLTVGFSTRITTTGPDGGYSFADVQADATPSLSVRPSFGTGYFTPTAVAEFVRCGDPPTIDFELVEQQRVGVRGTVVEGVPDPTDTSKFRGVAATDIPVAGATVNISTTGSVATAADGTYENEIGLLAPDNRPVRATFGAYGGGYWQQIRQILVDAGPPIEADLVVVPACTALVGARGRVTDQHGTPLADRRLSLSGSQGPPSINPGERNIGLVFSDADGNFEFPAAETYFGYNNSAWSFVIRDTATNNRNVGSFTHFGCDTTHVEEIDVVVELFTSTPPVRREGRVSGRLVDAETGTPVEGVALHGDRTDADGRFTSSNIFIGYDQFTVLTTFEINVNPTFSYYGTKVGPFTVVADQTTEVGDIALVPVHHFGVEGYVLDEITGLPVERATVTVNQPGRGGITVNTDENGYYERTGMIPPGVNQPQTISVTISKKPVYQLPDEYFTKTTSVDLTPGEIARHDVPLLRRCLDATISGIVVDAVTGLPIAGANVNGQLTDADGFFLLEGLGAGAYNQPGSVLLTASAPGYVTLKKSVTVFCGANIVVNFGAETGTGIVFGNVVDENGVPVDGARIVAETGNDDASDAAGDYRIVDIPLGLDGGPTEWDITAIHPDGRRLVLPAVVTNGGETELDFRFDAPVEPPNLPPLAFDVSATVNAGESVPITLRGADADGDDVTLTIETFPSVGTVTGTPPAVTYSAPPGAGGLVTFTYTASDGEDTSEPATVSITVVPPNTPPTANDISTSVVAGESVSITLSGGDADGDPYTFQLLNQPSVGSITGNPPSLTYTAPVDAGGEVATFEYVTTDGEDTSTPATVTISILAQPPNNPPTARSFFVEVLAGDAIDIELDGLDADGDPLTFSVVTQPEAGQLTGEPPDLRYTAPDDGTSQASFTYVADDGQDISEPATVAITILPPQETGSVYGTVKDDLGNPIRGAEVYSEAARDFAFTSQDGSYVFLEVPVGTSRFFALTPDRRELLRSVEVVADEATELNFVFPTDGGPTNHPPTADDISTSVTAGESVEITLTGSDPDGDLLAFHVVGEPTFGLLDGDEPDLIYFAPAGSSGLVTFDYIAEDGLLASDPATVTIIIEEPETNTPPVADDIETSVVAGESVEIVLTGSDDDGDALAFSVVAPPTIGSLTGTEPDLTFHAPTGTGGEVASFTFTASDGTDASEPATVTISIDAPPDRPPVVAPIDDVTLDEGSTDSVEVTAVDPDGDDIALRMTLGPAWVSFDDLGGGAGSVRLAPTDDDVATVTVEACAAAACDHRTFTVTALNVAPSLVIDAPSSTPVGDDVSIRGVVTDPGDDTWSYRIDCGAGLGAPQTSPEFQCSFDTIGPAGISMLVSDDDGGEGQAAGTIDVTAEPEMAVSATNDGPAAWGTDVRLVASAVASGLDGPITYRWDLDDDGVPDTAPSNDPAVVVQFPDPGTWMVLAEACVDDVCATATTEVVVVRRPSSISPPVSPPVQYSDSTTVGSTLVDAIDGAPLSGRDVVVTVGGEPHSTATDSSGASATEWVADVGAGFVQLESRFDGDGRYEPATATGTLEVVPEDAHLEWVARPATPSTTFDVHVLVHEDPDGSLGDLTLAAVSFWVDEGCDGDPVAAGTFPIVDPEADGTGDVIATIAGSIAPGCVHAELSATGQRYTATPITALLADQTDGFVTGGGRYDTAEGWVSIGFVARREGGVLSGHVEIVHHGTEVVQRRSVALTGLTIVDEPDGGTTATITAEVLRRTDDGWVTDTITLVVHDGGAGRSRDHASCDACPPPTADGFRGQVVVHRLR